MLCTQNKAFLFAAAMSDSPGLPASFPPTQPPIERRGLREINSSRILRNILLSFWREETSYQKEQNQIGSRLLSPTDGAVSATFEGEKLQPGKLLLAINQV